MIRDQSMSYLEILIDVSIGNVVFPMKILERVQFPLIKEISDGVDTSFDVIKFRGG